MGERARTEEPANDTVEVSRDDFSRLVRTLERLVTIEERKLAAKGAAARKAEKQAGTTTDECLGYVRKRMRRMRGTP